MNTRLFTLVRTATALLLFPPVGAFAQLEPSADSVRRAEAVATETIPHLNLKGATFEEALAVIRRAWEERHPNESLPVAITDYRSPDGNREANVARITVELKNVPFLEALRHIGTLSGRDLISVNGLVQLEGREWIEEDWFTRAHNVTPQAFAALRISPDSDGAELRRAFERFGVQFEPWMRLGMTTTGQQIVVNSYRAQHEQIAGILFLVSKGYSITK